MSRLLFAIAVAAAAFYWWKGRSVDLGPASPNGFVAVVMPDGAPQNTAIILAPVNCPSDAAQRAERLSDELTRRGIPNLRSSTYSSEIQNPSDEQQQGMERAVAVMNGAIPAVFVNGMASANPTAEQVVAEYRRTRAAR